MVCCCDLLLLLLLSVVCCLLFVVVVVCCLLLLSVVVCCCCLLLLLLLSVCVSHSTHDYRGARAQGGEGQEAVLLVVNCFFLFFRLVWLCQSASLSVSESVC